VGERAVCVKPRRGLPDSPLGSGALLIALRRRDGQPLEAHQVLDCFEAQSHWTATVGVQPGEQRNLPALLDRSGQLLEPPQLRARLFGDVVIPATPAG